MTDRKPSGEETAFDSVSHDSVFLAAASVGIPGPLVEYVRSVYAGSKTRLRVNGILSQDISLKRGVRQGYPLSPVLFNAVVDLALPHLDSNIGVQVGSERLPCLAFADDLVLLASTPQGLQTQFNSIELALARCGLTLNVAKSATIRPDVCSARQKWICNPTGFLRGKDGTIMRAMSITEGYKYLGNTVSAGDTTGATVRDLKRGIQELTRAPLKPQQQLYILRNNLLPSLFRTAVLGSMAKTTLTFLDTITRAATRSWLRLPKDTPFAFSQADYRDGGLGMTPFVWTIPLLRTKRMAKLVSLPDPVVQAVSRLPIFARERRRRSAPLSAYGIPIRDGVGEASSQAMSTSGWCLGQP